MLIEVHELPHIIIFNDLFKLWSTVIHTNTCQHAFLWSECLRCFNNSSLNRFTTVQCRVGGIFLLALCFFFPRRRVSVWFSRRRRFRLCVMMNSLFRASRNLFPFNARLFNHINWFAWINIYFETAATESAVKIFCKVDWFHEMKKVSISVLFLSRIRRRVHEVLGWWWRGTQNRCLTIFWLPRTSFERLGAGISLNNPDV